MINSISKPTYKWLQIYTVFLIVGMLLVVAFTLNYGIHPREQWLDIALPITVLLILPTISLFIKNWPSRWNEIKEEALPWRIFIIFIFILGMLTVPLFIYLGISRGVPVLTAPLLMNGVSERSVPLTKISHSYEGFCRNGLVLTFKGFDEWKGLLLCTKKEYKNKYNVGQEMLVTVNYSWFGYILYQIYETQQN